jgi:hypothetical protein
MAHWSRLRLEIVGRAAFLFIVVVAFPTIYAQRRGDLVWVQAIGTCLWIACGIIGLRAGFLLKKTTESDTPLLQRLRWISALTFVVILICGFGAFAFLAHTKRALIIWSGISLFLIVCLFWKRHNGSNQTLQPTASRRE